MGWVEKMTGAMEIRRKEPVDLATSSISRTNSTRFWWPPQKLFLRSCSIKTAICKLGVNHLDPFESRSTKNRAIREEPRKQFPPSRPASPLSTGFPTFDRLPHNNRDGRKRVPIFAIFRAREFKVDRSYMKLKGSPKPWCPPAGVFAFSQRIENLVVSAVIGLLR